MPRRDGTGPRGAGPRTGYGLGNCKPAIDIDDADVKEVKEVKEVKNSILERLNSGIRKGFGKGKGKGRSKGRSPGRGRNW